MCTFIYWLFRGNDWRILGRCQRRRTTTFFPWKMWGTQDTSTYLISIKHRPYEFNHCLTRTTSGYRIIVFFCWCKFLRFVSKVSQCNLCYFFVISHHCHPIFFFRWYGKKIVSTLSTRVLWACAFTLKSRSFSALFNTSINPSRNTCVLFLWTQVIGPGMTQAVGSNSSCFELRKLGSCVYNHGIRRWCSLSSPCLYQRKHCISKITENILEFYFLFF